MRRALWLLIVLLFVAPVANVSADAPQPKDEAQYQILYEGEFIDRAQRPITGVFPLRFKLYKTARGGAPIWSEARFVSVVDGRYRVLLGTDNPLPVEAVGKKLHLAVEVNKREMFRQPFTPQAAGAAAAAGGVAAAGGYSDQCGLCDDADRLGGKSADSYATDLELAAVNKQLDGLSKSAGKDPKGGGGATVGSKTQDVGPAGGKGGRRYNLRCPPGQVVVGITGGAGAVVDSLNVICAPLE